MREGAYVTRKLPALPIDPDRFVSAIEAISRFLQESTGQRAELVGDTRVLVPLALLLRRQGFSQDEIISTLLRLRALQLLLASGALADWEVGDSGHGELAPVHIAVGEAAAVLPLAAADDRFPPEPFVRRVREIIAARYPRDLQRAMEVPLS
jgi:hypothetical protein